MFIKTSKGVINTDYVVRTYRAPSKTDPDWVQVVGSGPVQSMGEGNLVIVLGIDDGSEEYSALPMTIQLGGKEAEAFEAELSWIDLDGKYHTPTDISRVNEAKEE